MWSGCGRTMTEKEFWAWVRERVAQEGLTEEIEAEARSLVLDAIFDVTVETIYDDD
jgi:hypothetical protein